MRLVALLHCLPWALFCFGGAAAPLLAFAALGGLIHLLETGALFCFVSVLAESRFALGSGGNWLLLSCWRVRLATS